MPLISRKVIANVPFHYPFGGIPSKNALEDYSGKKDELLKVLFLGCGDVHSALHTAAICSSSGFLEIHLNDVSATVMARNVLLLRVSSAAEFDPNDLKDVEYLWSVWYNTEWPESTRQRFLKDVKELAAGNIPSHIWINDRDQEVLKGIWCRWSSSTTTVSKKQLERVRKERQRFLIDNWKNDPKYDGEEDLPFVELVKLLANKFGLAADLAGFDQNVKQMLFDELCQFVQTGNSALSNEEDLKVCINPTFLDPITKHWNVHYLICPYLTYKPIKVKETAAKGPLAIQHCLEVLQNIVAGYRSKQNQISLKLHVRDALEFCHESVDHFQVIDTSDLADYVGLANLVTAATIRLCPQTEHSTLITQSVHWESLAPSFSSYVESALAAPLSMIPSIYGIRPSDPVLLANEDPADVVACVKAEKLGDVLLTLKWTRTPPSTPVIPWKVSLPIQEFAKRLQRWCFYLGEGPTARREMCSMKCYTPLTYSHVIRSLANRVNWKQGMDSVLNYPKLPQPFNLSWKSIQDWAAGREVMEMSITTPIPPIFSIPSESSVPETAGFRLVLIAPSRVPPSWRTLNNPVATEGFWNDIHYVDNLDVCVNKDRDGLVKDVTLSFLLPKDHGLNGTLVAFILDILRWNQVAYLGSLMDFESRTCVSQKPVDEPIVHPLPTGGLAVESCEELEDRYELTIHVPGEGTVSDLSYKFRQQQLCESSHDLVICVQEPEEMKLNLSFTWPVLEDSPKTDVSGNRIRLVLKKAMCEPWPSEFQQHRWQDQQLSPWDKGILNLPMYTMAQYSFPDIVSGVFKSSTADWTCLPALDMIRFIMKYIIDGHPAATGTSDSYVSIMDKVGGSDYPDWFLRLHYPVRRTPSGSPLVILSAYDQKLGRKLIKEGKLSQENDSADMERLMLGGQSVSPYPVATIYTHTEEQAKLLRYVLRRNSCRLLPTAWQQENLPLGADKPWLATFVTPLYIDNLGSSSNEASKWTITNTDREFENMCARCCVVKEDVKRCARCKSVKYCSVRCQKADWSQHKLTCIA